MSDPKLNIAGAVDLSKLAAARQAQATSAQARAAAPEGSIFDAIESTFEATVVTKSNQVPVIVDFGSPRSGQSVQMSALLESFVAQYGGRIALAKVDAEQNQRLVQAFQLQQIPSYFLVLQGQVQPLFQGQIAEDQLRQLFDQILKLAEQTGLITANDTEPVEPPLDPRHQRAFDAIENSDWAAATEAYNEALSINPSDADAKAGLLQVAFLQRATVLDVDAVLAQAPTTSEDRLKRADALVLLGKLEEAFTLLVDAVRTDVEERDVYKERLLDFFTLMGDVQEVRDARRALTNALF